MARCPELPFLPGFTFNPLLGQTKFNRDNKFENYNGIPMLIEKVKPNMFGPFTDRYPSAYSRGEVVDLPGWIAFDKQILVFEGFYKQTLQEVALAPFQVRKVKIYFFLEDGTIQVIEPKVDNSGSAQGTLISRQRIRFPAPMDDNFYDILDFNVGREVELYGKVFKVTDCDRFTRNFLNRIGISVPDPIPPPPDPYLTHRNKTRITNLTRKPNIHVDTLGQFLANDRKVLRFYGYWDDRESENGILHDLEIHYYLADDTMEIKEVVPPNSGRDSGAMFMKRAKLPKVFKGLPGPGYDSNFTVLNVLGPSLGGRFIADALNCGKEVVHYYKENELTIGGIINCYGRRILLTDCDPYTKAYYRKKYGVDIFEPKPYPEDYVKAQCHTTIERELPPWNGYGTYEDSAVNCKSVELKAPHRDFQKFLKYDKVGLDSHILRFDARLISKSKINCSRIFTISYYLSDDTIGVYETARDNSGFKSSPFFKRLPVQLPGQAIFTSKAPKNYTAQHMYVGAQMIINSFQFVLIDSDEYALRFMEINAHEFPRSNIKLIMDKVREKLRPIYKDFVAENMPTESPAITYEKLRSKLCPLMGEDFVEQEMITIARAFSASCKDPKYDRNSIRAIVLTDLKRALWDDLERTREYFLVQDSSKSGVLSRKDCYTLMRACRIPLDTSVLEKILDVAQKDENCNIIYNDILNFLDRNKCPMADIIPINVKKEFWWASAKEPYHGRLINWCAFNDYLDLQNLIKEASGPFLNKPIEDA